MPVEPDIQRISRLTPLDDVLARIETLNPVMPHAIDVSGAQFHVLAEDVRAAAGFPAEARALVDGYAVRADETTDAGSYSPMPLAATPVRVDVGDAMPPGADAVVPLDTVVSRGGRFEVLAPATAGDGVLPAQGDFGAGGLVAKAGWRLSGLNVAMLAATGQTRALVREPRVRLVTTRPGPDALLDAAADLIARALAARGCVARRTAADLDDALADGKVTPSLPLVGPAAAAATQAYTRLRGSGASKRTALRFRRARPPHSG